MRGGELAITETAVAAAPLVGELASTDLLGLVLKQLFDSIGGGE